MDEVALDISDLEVEKWRGFVFLGVLESVSAAFPENYPHIYSIMGKDN